MNDPVTMGQVGRPDELAAAWSCLLDFHQGKSWTAWVDGFSDFDPSGELTTKARSAMDDIRSRTKTGMAVPLAIDDPSERRLVDAFGPYSIHAIVGPTDFDDRLGVHDGTDLWFTVDRSEIGEVRKALRVHGVDVDDLEVLPPDRQRPHLGVAIAGAALVALVLTWLIWS